MYVSHIVAPLVTARQMSDFRQWHTNRNCSDGRIPSIFSHQKIAGRREVHIITADGMAKPQFGGMQHQAAALRTVQLVAHDGATQSFGVSTVDAPAAMNISICNAIIGLQVLILTAVGLQIRQSGCFSHLFRNFAVFDGEITSTRQKKELFFVFALVIS